MACSRDGPGKAAAGTGPRKGVPARYAAVRDGAGCGACVLPHQPYSGAPVRGLRQYFAGASGRSHPLRRRSGWQALLSARRPPLKPDQANRLALVSPGWVLHFAALCQASSGRRQWRAQRFPASLAQSARAQESLRSNQRPLRSATGKEMVTSTVGLPPTSLADENPLAGTEPLRRTTGCPAGVGLGCPSPSKPWSPPWGNAWTGSRRESATSACFSRPTSAPPRQWGEAIAAASFEDPEWVERWDVIFAELYLAALDTELDAGGEVPRPWRSRQHRTCPRCVTSCSGINAHVNYDLPQALLAVISSDDFTDPVLMQRRRRDHERIDHVLSSRVAAEDDELIAMGGTSILGRLLTPLNRLGSQRFLREARQKVWHNTLELQDARLAGPHQYAARLAELELLSAAKIADLLRPGQVVLRLAVAGFGVTLPPHGGVQRGQMPQAPR